ncbi:50S ribosomal protein L24 [Candidatus Daviesbacteria bacterium RIFCSPHIGHO2_02_FULL_39_12]|uniref:Large ribosomal subunit protein uL24 n=2 Tax=Candidatus Daviesiibacteriota TaxID=1752718 RepID=A0A1F5J9P2_9BACT|nr:MAG: 50S ribosomal protein L24 [Candidatus Daviesbacteria bacterium RIFCSPHIGHO2_02_FULL_39_12]OGE72604.1 MAG: 50S ribosomal protein L24 [Candidatus Daviesbacteria bacterium RIFCSPLOWO2_02_FULL_38_15]
MAKSKVKIQKSKIKKGDKVKIMLGKDRGKEGTVEYVLAKKNKLFVGGVNLYKRHVRKLKDIEGGIINIPKPMNVSNVALICPTCQKSTRIGLKVMGDAKVRMCKKCGKEIDKGKA